MGKPSNYGRAQTLSPRCSILTSLGAALVPLERAHAVALLDSDPGPVLICERMLGTRVRLEGGKRVVEKSLLRSTHVQGPRHVRTTRLFGN